jgi:hypothetical protein
VANWYVDNAASGANDGTSWVAAWQSFADIQWNLVDPGDTLYISGGSTSKTYTEFLVLDAVTGNSGNPITIKAGEDAGHNGTVHLNGGHAIEVLTGTEYVTIENFVMDGGSSWGIVGSGVTCSDITIRNVEITGNANFMIYFDSCNNLVIDDCYIHDNFESGGTVLPISIRNSSNVTIKNTRCYNNDDDLGASGDADGIHIRDCSPVRIENCDMRDNSEDQYDLEGDCTLVNCLAYGGYNGLKLFGGGIFYTYEIYNSVFHDATQANTITRYGATIEMYNCIFEGAGQYGFRIITDSGYTTTATIYNSIFANNGSGYQIANAYPYSFTTSHNCWYNNGTGSNGEAGPPAEEDSPVTGDPLFVSVSGHDWNLQEGSPCREAGVSVGYTEAQTDFNGDERTGEWDIGIYAYSIEYSPTWYVYGDSGDL